MTTMRAVVQILSLLTCACSAAVAPSPPDAAPASDGTAADTLNAELTGSGADGAEVAPALGPPLAMDFARGAALLDAPFPADDLRLADGRVNLSALANPSHIGLVDQCLALIARDARGFAQTGAIYFRSAAAIAADTLPTLAASISDGASVYLLAISPNAADFMQKIPIDVAFLPDAGPLGGPNLLAILPLQGAPLLPAQTYAAVVTDKVRYADGSRIGRFETLDGWAAGPGPALGKPLFAALTADQAAHVRAWTVFTTDDRAAQLSQVVAHAASHHPASALAAAPTLTEVFDGFCVFEAKIDLPVYQSGTPPYSAQGGDWRFDADGTPRFDHSETARIWFSVPRLPPPTEGFPTVFFIGAGGGGERAMVDRGVCTTQNFSVADKPGSGPAQEYARVGWAGVTFDGTLEGIRNTTHGNEDFLLFNIFNPGALRDNVRQSALEMRLVRKRLAGSIAFDASTCPGVGKTPFAINPLRTAVMGHSMGATILPLTLSTSSDFAAAILSGAGGSYIANVMDKLLPLTVKPIAEGLLGYPEGTLTRFDPALTLFQWAVEASDPQIYAPTIIHPDGSGPHVLMLQGLVDHYILPNIANAVSLPLGLSLGGAALDGTIPELIASGQRSLVDLLPLVGRSALPLPASGNRFGRTAIVVQNLGDSHEDGHETNFQTERPKRQYRCFLADIAAGQVPVVRDVSAESCW